MFFKDVEIFTVEMMCCLGFALKESRIVGRRMYAVLQREQNKPGEFRIVDW